MFSRLTAFIVTLLTACTFMTYAANADTRLQEARSLVQEMADAVKQTVEADYESDKDRVAAVDVLIENYFDFAGITRFSAGRYWKKATEQERTDYAFLFREVLTGLAVRQFEQLRGLEYQVTDAVSKGKKLVLVTGIMSDPTGAQADTIVSWRVSTIEGKAPLIIDVEIENISMLITQQQENTAIVRKNGGKFSALIDILRDAKNQM